MTDTPASGYVGFSPKTSLLSPLRTIIIMTRFIVATMIIYHVACAHGALVITMGTGLEAFMGLTLLFEDVG